MRKTLPPFDGRFDHELFAPIMPYDQGYLELDGDTRLYYEQAGNEKGPVALYLHGGPGAGLNAVHWRYFDPEVYRIIQFDQRGAGKSRPHARSLLNLERNRTDQLCEDIEALRAHLGIERWLIMGGSWGTTLALAYAQSQPERVTALILRSLYMGSKAEIEHFFTGLPVYFPEAFARFIKKLMALSGLKIVPKKTEDILAAALELLCPNLPLDEEKCAKQEAMAQAWVQYEFACSRLKLSKEIAQDMQRFDNAQQNTALAILEAQYMAHHCFLEPQALAQNMMRLADIPIVLLQGRHDVLCPPKIAWDLAQDNPNIMLRVIENAAHSLYDRPLRVACVGAAHYCQRYFLNR